MNPPDKFLSETTVAADPFHQFEMWYLVRLSSGLAIPESVALGTTSPGGRVSARMVLLKDFNKSGFVFYSNYNSRKGIQIGQNPQASLLFYWPETARQIRIEGTVSRISRAESDRYFNSRPEESRLAAWASEQSSVISDREYLEGRFEYYRNYFRNKPIERPPQWGGYRLVPDWFEFWQEREFRLHDRITYSLKEDTWIISRLAP